MTFSKPTLATLIVSAVIAPWLAKHGAPALSPEWQDFLASALVAASGAAANWLHARMAAKPLPPPAQPK